MFKNSRHHWLQCPASLLANFIPTAPTLQNTTSFALAQKHHLFYEPREAPEAWSNLYPNDQLGLNPYLLKYRVLPFLRTCMFYLKGKLCCSVWVFCVFQKPKKSSADWDTVLRLDFPHWNFPWSPENPEHKHRTNFCCNFTSRDWGWPDGLTVLLTLLHGLICWIFLRNHEKLKCICVLFQFFGTKNITKLL